MKLKLVTLNLYRYYSWDKRLTAILDFLAKTGADIIALQEVQLNPSFSPLPQSTFLAKELGYGHHVFAATSLKKEQVDPEGVRRVQASHGMAILSRHPIHEVQSIMLTKSAADREQRSILLGTVALPNMKIGICNVHFNNSDKDAELHLVETLDILKNQHIHPIILGDFNIYNLERYKATMPHYKISSEACDYTSYPSDNASLDYIAIPQDIFDFASVECADVEISDHRPVAVLLDIKIKAPRQGRE